MTYVAPPSRFTTAYIDLQHIRAGISKYQENFFSSDPSVLGKQLEVTSRALQEVGEVLSPFNKPEINSQIKMAKNSCEVLRLSLSFIFHRAVVTPKKVVSTEDEAEIPTLPAAAPRSTPPTISTSTSSRTAPSHRPAATPIWKEEFRQKIEAALGSRPASLETVKYTLEKSDSLSSFERDITELYGIYLRAGNRDQLKKKKAIYLDEDAYSKTIEAINLIKSPAPVAPPAARPTRPVIPTLSSARPVPLHTAPLSNWRGDLRDKINTAFSKRPASGDTVLHKLEECDSLASFEAAIRELHGIFQSVNGDRNKLKQRPYLDVDAFNKALALIEQKKRPFDVTPVAASASSSSHVSPLPPAQLATALPGLSSSSSSISATPASADDISHDAAAWKRNYERYLSTWNRGGRESICVMNGPIFAQTLEAIKTGYGLNLIVAAEMRLGTKYYRDLPPQKLSSVHPSTKFDVLNMSTFEAIKFTTQAGLLPLVLDMANPDKVGGDPGHATTQEETLCRQSTLYSGLMRQAGSGNNYITPLGNGGIFVPHVQFFRSEPKDGYAFITPIVCDVFASAAYNCNPAHKAGIHGSGYNRPTTSEEYSKGTMEKMRVMCRAAVLNKNDCLILSAFGCGAYKNNPHTIAGLYKIVLSESEFQGAFKRVVFAIKDPLSSLPSTNCEIFQKIFSES